MPTVAEVIAVAETLWPIAGAEPWDAVGLISGSPHAAVNRIHLAVDAVPETAEEAVNVDAQILLVHHPLLLRGVTTVAETDYKGAVLARLIQGGTALLAAHTNADVVETGTSAVLANLIGLLDPVAIRPGGDPARGIGRVGRLAEPLSLGRLARRLAELLPATASGIRVSGDFDELVSLVALCGGAGDSLLGEDAVLGSDVYITSDLRHHPASEFRETARVLGGPALIDVSHWASEWLWLETAAQQLRGAFEDVKVSVSELRTDPWDFVVVQ